MKYDTPLADNGVPSSTEGALAHAATRRVAPLATRVLRTAGAASEAPCQRMAATMSALNRFTCHVAPPRVVRIFT